MGTYKCRLVYYISNKVILAEQALHTTVRPFLPCEREKLLTSCQSTLRSLEVRAIPGETNLSFSLKELHSLTLDQGVHLGTLSICCPKLQYLRIQGCPQLSSLSLTVPTLSQIIVSHSTPLIRLRCLNLYCKKVTQLSKILSYYCPNIQELCLHGSEIKMSQLHVLTRDLCRLTTVRLYHCVVKGWDTMLKSEVSEVTNTEAGYSIKELLVLQKVNGSEMVVEYFK